MPTLLPVISIGMPVYNGAAHLAVALESLLAQSFTDFEIIISDNCSSDGTARIIAEFALKDPRVRVTRQAENIGPMRNFQFVLELARAPYFMWAAYDDWWDPNYIEVLHNALTSDADKKMAVARIVRQRMDGTVAEITETPTMRHLGRVSRITRMLALARGGSIYGLYRTGAIRHSYARAIRDFPHVWASDHLIIFPFYINDCVTGVAGTNFYNRDTGLSSGRYRPGTAHDLWRFMCDFVRYAAREVLESRLYIMGKGDLPDVSCPLQQRQGRKMAASVCSSHDGAVYSFIGAE